MAGPVPYHAMYTRHSMERPLPSLPSPTLTNPDMVLPDDIPSNLPPLPSPPRRNWSQRPPSPGYLQDQARGSGHQREMSESSGSTMTVTGDQQDQNGRMSRKMMPVYNQSGETLHSKSTSNRRSLGDHNGVVAERGFPSSPTYLDVKHSGLRPGQGQEYKRPSWSSTDESDNFNSTNDFMAKYGQESAPTDDGFESDDTDAPKRSGVHTSDSDIESQRRRQQEDEQASLMLSQRAEQILANAKKRLNLMEGNLRGARDLVAPLTAANLKRATSVGSTTSSYRGQYGGDGFRYDSSGLRPLRTLQSQTSSPSMLRDYRSGHWRNVSESGVPERPRSALNRTSSPVTPMAKFPVKVSDSSLESSLRGSKSYDSLGRRPGSREFTHLRNSPESGLEPVDEDGPAVDAESYTGSQSGSERPSSIASRTPSRADGLYEKMTSLQGRISSLKERAKEDSLRRLSMQSLREPSPLNNAVASAPEVFYTPGQSQSNPNSQVKSRLGFSTPTHSPSPSQDVFSAAAHPQSDESPRPFAGSRNAFAEQAARHIQSAHYALSGRPGAQSAQQLRGAPFDGSPAYDSPNRTAVSEDADDAQSIRTDPQGVYDISTSNRREMGNPNFLSYDQNKAAQGSGNNTASKSQGPRRNSLHSVDASSVYEDAQTHQHVAHEDREDAFDYENFFLHSKMNISRNGFRDEDEEEDDSTSSTGSVSSAGTARGPTTVASDGDDEYDFEATDSDDDNASLTESSPQVPDRSQQGSRMQSFHSRSVSRISASTYATFATAYEGGEDFPASTEEDAPEMPSLADWPIPATMTTIPAAPSQARDASPPNYSRPTSRGPSRSESRNNNNVSRADSRPTTAIPNKQRSALSDCSSERADSGVGGLETHNQRTHRAADSMGSNTIDNNNTTGNDRRPQPIGNLPLRASGGVAASAASGHNGNTLSPPMSPSAMMLQNPETAIVNALLDPSGPSLGLKDKAMLFGLVHDLTQAVRHLQRRGGDGNDGGDVDADQSRAMRAKLEEMKRVLEN